MTKNTLPKTKKSFNQEYDQKVEELKKLLTIMKQLRDPLEGCPWDRVQTNSSISQFTIEEAYEVVEAVNNDNPSELCNELGDLLFQVVFHSQIAKENGYFDFFNVLKQLNSKMIRRHPHVFETKDKAKTLEQQRVDWETIKSKERSKNIETSPVSELDDIPVSLPENYRAMKIQERAASVGFDWTEISSVIDKIYEEIIELVEAKNMGDNNKIEEEYGDLIFTIINLGRHLNLHPEIALKKANEKFIKRFKHLEANLRTNGQTIRQSDPEGLNAQWQEIKSSEINN
jgi:ATP diphosphatase